MNRSALKKYAPQARLDFIEAVTLRARRLGLDPVLPVSVEQTGDVLLIGGQPFPASVAKQRTALTQRIQQQGFGAVVEALAYTWFNRLVAIRFMELKGYLSHGYRVLSHPEGQQPEILEHAQHLDLPGLDKEEVIRLKTAGNQDEALYREILLAQCHELHRNMPFLFEALDDATELLLPDNLLRTDSLIAHLVSDIEEADWQEVEVIGWLYQFYISDKKDEVIGKVVKSKDIPAATQLFTPNWIVQYMVQNSLGRLWLMANPGSSLKEKMPYYIEPAEQTQEVQAQLDALIKVRMDEDGGTLNPESLTVLDPACGSGHILVEAYNLLRAIYEERGYRLREIPRLILQKNLYGLDIDDRAAQLAGFALLMKAREDDRRLFDEEGNPPHLNVMAIQQSAGLPDEEMARSIINAAIQIEGGDAFNSGQLFGGGQLETQHSSGLTVLDLRQLIQLFEHGKTFGSLISVPDALTTKLRLIVDLLVNVRNQGDDLSRSYSRQILEQFVWPASLLAMKYDSVLANPPYMSGGFKILTDYTKKNYKDSCADLFACFIERSLIFTKYSGCASLVTLQSWMFSSSYEGLRIKLIESNTISSLVHVGFNSFPTLNSKIAIACMFVVGHMRVKGYLANYIDLNSADKSADKEVVFLERDKSAEFVRDQETFKSIPGCPVSYSISCQGLKAFQGGKLSDIGKTRRGLQTGDKDRFIRYWYECALGSIEFRSVGREDASKSDKKWYVFNNGGDFRRWYGSVDLVVDWENDGALLKSYAKSIIPSEKLYFEPAICWSRLTYNFGFRLHAKGVIPGDLSPCFYPDGDYIFILAYMNSTVAEYFINLINPSLTKAVGDVAKIPVPDLEDNIRLKVCSLANDLVSIYKEDWCCLETSIGFPGGVFDFSSVTLANLESCFLRLCEKREQVSHLAMSLEEEINSLIAEGTGLASAVDVKVPLSRVSLFQNASYRYGDDVPNGIVRVSLLRADFGMELISHAVGYMVGRYSLDEPGIIYAHSGNVGFDASRYTKFPADADGIIPITDETWFADDASERVREFVKVVWGAETLVENMEWLADSLGRKAGESADEAIRRYLSTSFYKDHLQIYKKRPIYWLFSSGKQKAFECLVYLHRYNEGTLSRMRMEYVVPLQSRMQARIDKLTDDIDSATSSVQQKALQKRKDKLTKQLEELRRFDENLRPYADQRITLDLDDGVKVNYGKFGNLLADVKAITGGK